MIEDIWCAWRTRYVLLWERTLIPGEDQRPNVRHEARGVRASLRNGDRWRKNIVLFRTMIS